MENFTSQNPTKFQNRHQVSVNALRTPIIHVFFAVCTFTVCQTYVSRARKQHQLNPDQPVPLLVKGADLLSGAFSEYKLRMLDIRKRSQ